MKDTIVIRTATREDLETLLRFEQEIIRAERPFDDTLKEGTIHYYDLGAMLSETDVDIVVAEIKGDIVASGYVRIAEAKPYLKYGRYAYLGFMYVVPAYRGKGINQMVVNKLAQFAKANGITELQLDVYAGNETAVRAYEKAGFAKHLINMRKEI